MFGSMFDGLSLEKKIDTRLSESQESEKLSFIYFVSDRPGLSLSCKTDLIGAMKMTRQVLRKEMFYCLTGIKKRNDIFQETAKFIHVTSIK